MSGQPTLERQNPWGNPEALAYWLYEQRLPPSEHRILDLMVRKADPEDGALWWGEEWFAHWSDMSVRNVRRVVRKLERRGLIKVWLLPRRVTVYQVQCPELPKMGDLARVEQARGVKLGAAHRLADNLSGMDSPDIAGQDTGHSGPVGGELTGHSGPAADPGCPPEVVKEVTSNNEVKRNGAPDGAAPLAAEAAEAEEPREPQPPNDQHEPFQRLHWHIYQARVKFLDDRHYDPWPRGKAKAEAKALAQCKTLMEGPAQGDLTEAKRRLGNLCSWRNHDPDFFDITAGELLAKWPKLLNPPQGRGPRFSGAMPPKPTDAGTAAPGDEVRD